MNENNTVNSYPTISYSYKTITLYFEIYKKIYDYKNIKRCTLRLDKASIYAQYLDMYCAIFLMNSIVTLEKRVKTFEKIFQIKTDDKFKSNLSQILSIKDIKTKLNSLLRYSFSLNDEKSYLVYLIFLYEANKIYDQLTILPLSIKEDIEKINDFRISTIYLDIVLEQCGLCNNKENLYFKLKEYLKSNEVDIRQNIKSIYLFGSLNTDTFHHESDIDLVFEFKKIDSSIKEIISQYSNNLFCILKRRIDVHEYNDFILLHPDVVLEKLL